MPHDPLSIAFKAGKLNRNFMGYTTDISPTLIGLGASSISDFNTAYVQNYKEVETYQSTIASGHLAIEKGHLLTEEDVTNKRHIMDVMCKGKIKLPNDLSPEHLAYIEEKITEFINDGLLQWENESLVATEAGLLLIRNIASIMDPYLYRLGMRDNVFSKSI
jgi:oxygen-independent coproporphyrinogen-3 oxidase